MSPETPNALLFRCIILISVAFRERSTAPLLPVSAWSAHGTQAVLYHCCACGNMYACAHMAGLNGAFKECQRFWVMLNINHFWISTTTTQF